MRFLFWRSSESESAEQLLIDHSHCGHRPLTGLERISLELFSAENLAPYRVETITARSKGEMILAQNVRLFWRALQKPRALVLAPGFPPGFAIQLFADRLIPYIHDLFLITRPGDLNLNAKLYMAAPFRLAVKRLPRFMVNSQTTASELRKFCRPDADIRLFRPKISNIFGIAPQQRLKQSKTVSSLRLLAIGTIEPRKNLLAAAAIVSHLRNGPFPDAVLEIVGRPGWGEDYEKLKRQPGVVLHGYKNVREIRTLIEDADFFITTSHDEGLGLTPLEAQYAGLATLAPDKPVFREALADSGIFFDVDRPGEASEKISQAVRQPDWRQRAGANALANLARWNALAEGDKQSILKWFGSLLARLER